MQQIFIDSHWVLGAGLGVRNKAENKNGRVPATWDFYLCRGENQQTGKLINNIIPVNGNLYERQPTSRTRAQRGKRVVLNWVAREVLSQRGWYLHWGEFAVPFPADIWQSLWVFSL